MNPSKSQLTDSLVEQVNAHKDAYHASVTKLVSEYESKMKQAPKAQLTDEFVLNLNELANKYNEAVAKSIDEFRKSTLPSPPSSLPPPPPPPPTIVYQSLSSSPPLFYNVRRRVSFSQEKPKELPPKEKEELEEEELEDDNHENYEMSDRNFVVDDSDEEGLNAKYDPDDDEKDEGLLVLVPEGSKRRGRKRTLVEDEEEDEDYEEDHSESIGKEGSGEGSEEDQWRLLRKKSYSELKLNPWFKRRFMDHFRIVRSNLGLEGHNALGLTVWDNIADHPYKWSFEEVDTFQGTCALCSYKKPLCLKGTDAQKKRDYFFSSCCGPLAESWTQFHTLLAFKGTSLKDMEEARKNVLEAQSKKKKRSKR